MNQNEKILYIAKILLDRTNFDHPLTANQLISELGEWGVAIERKSIYSSIETLQTFRMDIEHSKVDPKGYYIASRDFELPEIKLLVDAVQSSKFITKKKSIELINKIKTLTDKYSVSTLQRQIVVSGRVKTENERVYYCIEAIHEAIAKDKQISFQYCEYDIHKNLVPRKDGKLYVYTPCLLLWDDDYYYLVAYNSNHESYTHFRTDKMQNVTIECADADKPKVDLDIARYSMSIFSMFSGNFEKVTIVAQNNLIGAFLDKFGLDIILHRHSDTEFSVTAKVAVSNTFFAWLFQFGDMVAVVSPSHVVQNYKKQMEKNINLYNQDN